RPFDPRGYDPVLFLRRRGDSAGVETMLVGEAARVLEADAIRSGCRGFRRRAAPRKLGAVIGRRFALGRKGPFARLVRVAVAESTPRLAVALGRGVGLT